MTNRQVETIVRTIRQLAWIIGFAYLGIAGIGRGEVMWPALFFWVSGWMSRVLIVDLQTSIKERVVERIDQRDAIKALAEVERLLTYLQPHIEQACYPGRAAFIDNYVDPAVELIRTVLHASQKNPAK